MSDNVDNRVVSMQFDNSKFESGVSQTLTTLDKLKESLQFPGAGKGLENVQAQANRFSLQHIASSVDSIRDKFSALKISAITALATITSRAVSAGISVVKSFTIDPLREGFQNYETQIGAVQTILANTGLKGAKGMAQVNKVLAQLNTYANKTIYNFSQMAKNIGTFTAAGVDLKTSEESIKGIANLAALSGSSAEQASNAMYQLSQAIAAGRVQLQDWNSVTTAGIGGKVFQKSLITTAEALGTIKANAVKTVGPMKSLVVNGESFRQSLSARGKQKSWLTSDVLTTALSNFTGDLSKAQLAGEGFSAAQIKAIQAQAKVANDAATKVKSLTQLEQSLKEEVGTAYAAIFKTLIGNINQAKALFSPLHQTLENALTNPLKAINKELKGWAKLGGRTAAIGAFKAAFEDLDQILKPLKGAFREIFPKETGQELADLTKKVEDFFKSLKIGAKTSKELKQTFAGVFAVLDIGRQVIEGVIDVIGHLFGVVVKGSGGFLQLTSYIGRWLVALDRAVHKGNGLTKFFKNLGNILAVPLEVFQSLHDVLYGLFDGFDPHFGDKIQKIFGGIGTSSDNLQKKISGIGNFFHNIGKDVGQALSKINWGTVFAGVTAGLTGGLLLVLKNFFSKDLTHHLGGGLLGGLRELVETLTGVTKAVVTTKTYVSAIFEIAAALALLAAAMVAMSLVNPKRLQGAMAGLAIGLGSLVAGLKVLLSSGTVLGALKLPVLAGSLILLAGALDALSIAVVILSKLDWEQLAKGLAGVVGLLTALSAASIPLSKNSKGMISAGIGITAMAIGLNIMALAVKQLGNLDLAVLAKGVGAVAVTLGAIGVASRLFPKGMVGIGAGLILIGAGLKLLSGSIAVLGAMDLKTLGTGIAAIAVALAAIGAALQLMPASAVLQAAGLLLLAEALKGIDSAIKTMGNTSLTVLAKGIGSLAASLIVFALGLDAMSGSLAGAAALTVAAIGIGLLVKSLSKLGNESWLQLAKGMAGLAGAMVILGLAGTAIEPAAAGLLALGAAMVLIGGGFALLGLGITLIATGIAELAVAGPAGIKIFLSAMVAVGEALPQLVQSLVQSLLALVQTIAKDAPEFVTALGKILDAMAKVIVDNAPKLATAFIAVIDAILKVITSEDSKIINAGIKVLSDFLKGLSQNIRAIVTMAADIITKFLTALGSKASQILNAGANLIVSLLKGITNNVDKIVIAAATLIGKFIVSLGQNGSKIVEAGGKFIASLVTGIAKAYGDVITAGSTAIIRFASGLGNNVEKIEAAGVKAMIKFLDGTASSAVNFAKGALSALLKFLTALDGVINSYEHQIVAAGIEIGIDVVKGIPQGMLQAAKDEIPGAVKKVAGIIVGGLRFALGTHSPSVYTTEIGKYVTQGLAIGMSSEKSLDKVVNNIGNGIINGFKDIFEIQSPSKVMEEIGRYVGQGFAKGLRGSTDDIKSAYQDLNNKLQDGTDEIKSNIETQQKSLDALADKIKKDNEEIAKAKKSAAESSTIDQARVNKDQQSLDDAQKNYDKIKTKAKATAAQIEAARLRVVSATNTLASASKSLNDNGSNIGDLETQLTKDQGKFATAEKTLTQYKNVLKEVESAHTEFAKSLSNDQTLLVNYANQYDKIADKLKNAQQALKNLQQNKADFISQTTSQFETLPDIATTDSDGNAIDPLVTYTQGLATQAAAVTKYMSTLEQLRKLGIDDDTYNKLLQDGTADQQFATELLQGGATAIAGINQLDKQLDNAAGKLATDAGNNMFNAGIAAAQGIVNGLESQEQKIQDEMTKIADAMVAAIKKKLKIKSPSQVFFDLGAFSSEGFANGLSASTKMVGDAASDLGNSAVQAVTASIKSISSTISDGIDGNPVITPVLDLTQIQAGAKQLNSLTSQATVDATTSYGQAAAISAARRTSTSDTAGGKDQPQGPIQFIQNNESPKALSEIDIYRNTKNMLSQARAVLE